MTNGRPLSNAQSRVSGVLAIAGLVLLVTNFLWHQGDRRLGGLRWSMRYWEDVGASIRHYFGFPSLEDGVSGDEAGRKEQRDALRDLMVARVERAGITPMEFWRTLHDRPFLGNAESLPRARINQDVGRYHLFAWGYRVLEGVSPFVPLWIGLLFFIPVLVGTLMELRRAGRPWAAAVLSLVVGASIFVDEILALPHSAVAFYWIGLVSVVGFASYCCLAMVRRRGLAVRAVLYGALWALCIWVRHGTLLVGTGFVVALLIGVARIQPPSRLSRRAVWFVALALVFLSPHLLARDAIPRPVWFSLWEGLGDFDRKYGHTWLDPEAVRVAGAAGVDTGPDQIGYSSPAAEAFFRATVLRHIREDPGWYLAILAKRAASTMSLWWVWPPYTKGEAYRQSTSPQQGMQDAYFGMAWPVDFLVVGPKAFEAPIFLIVAPTLTLLVWGLALQNPSARSSLTVVCCVALGALAAPVLVTTASGMPQMFGLVHFLALGLLADAWVAKVSTRRPATTAAFLRSRRTA